LLSARARSLTLARPIGTAVGGLFLVVALLSFGTTSAMMVADHYLRRSYEVDMPQSLEYARKAESAMPLVAQYRMRTAYLLGSVAQRDTAEGTAPGALESAVVAYEDLLEFDSNNYEAVVRYADLLNAVHPAGGELSADRALEVSRIARRLFPAGLYPRVCEARALMNLERPHDAVEVLAPVWDADADYAEPGILYARALWSAGRREEAVSAARGLTSLYPDDSEVQALVAEIGVLSATE
ncbi:MAG: tetratricopeptide repeat protein, partial [Coriobacteriia bacterium]|nr:tetratricopeptide repeat protein [Coriobacteriia bacterium]